MFKHMHQLTRLMITGSSVSYLFRACTRLFLNSVTPAFGSFRKCSLLCKLGEVYILFMQILRSEKSGHPSWNNGMIWNPTHKLGRISHFTRSVCTIAYYERTTHKTLNSLVDSQMAEKKWTIENRRYG